MKKTITTKQEVPEPKIEVCGFCGQEFDVSKRDNSGYLPRMDSSGNLSSIPICTCCREDYL